jgi:broad specificity phosphatase PhoE
VLILVRHGQSTHNAAGRLSGRDDVGLTELGARQAAAVAQAVHAQGGVTRVISSPLQRARSTAAAFGLPVSVDDRWIEVDYGEWDGVPVDSVPAEKWDAWRADVSYAPLGGESLAAVGARVRTACTELMADAVDGRVVVVSHVSPIKAAVAWALGVPDQTVWRMFLSPASISCIGVNDRGPFLHNYNGTAHLAAIAATAAV